jgi:hypothetical protein
VCAKDQLIEFLNGLPHHDLCMLFNALDVAHQHLIYESTDERLLMDQFMVCLWLATRGRNITEETSG